MNDRGMLNVGPFYMTDAGGRPGEAAQVDIPGYGGNYGMAGAGGVGQAPSMPGFPGLPGVPGFPAIPGMNSTGVPELDSMTDLLEGMNTYGLHTPWAAQTADYQWEDLFAGGRTPEWNVSLYDFREVSQKLAQMALGLPGWVGILTDQPKQLSHLEHEFNGTPYEFFSGQAVFNQADPNSPPRIQFLYWGRRRDPADPEGGNANVANIAQRQSGRLVWGMQLMYGDTAQRRAPATSFSEAFDRQFGTVFAPSLPDSGVAPPEGERPVPGNGDEVTDALAPANGQYVGPSTAALWVAGAFAVAAAIGGYYLAQGVK